MTSLATHPLFELISKQTQQQLLLLEPLIGQPCSKIAEVLGTTPGHIKELNMDFFKRKGSMGVFGEQLVTGIRGNNKSDADDGIVEIKTISVPKQGSKPSKYDLSNGYKIKEVLRLSKLNPQLIQTQPFNESGLCKKTIMLIVLVEYTKQIENSILVGFAFLDLRPYLTEMEVDYNNVAEYCRQGLAHTFRSSSTQLCNFAKLYSNGQGDNKATYFDQKGNKCEYKNKSFYIFKDKLVELLEIL